MAIEPTTGGIAAGILFILTNATAFWYREWRKHKTWRSNGNDLKEIKDKVKCIDKTVGETKLKMVEIKSAVKAQKEQCGKTVSRFDQAIIKQQDELLKIARGK